MLDQAETDSTVLVFTRALEIDEQLEARIARVAHRLAAAQILEGAARRPLARSKAPALKGRGGTQPAPAGATGTIEQQLEAAAQAAATHLRQLLMDRATGSPATVAPLVADVMRQLGVAAKGSALLVVQRAVLDGAIEAWVHEHDRLSLAPRQVASLEEAALRARGVEAAAGPGPSPGPAPAIVAAIPPTIPTFTEAFEVYVDHLKATSRSKNPGKEVASTRRIFVDLFGDLPLNQITRQVLQDFTAALGQIPADYRLNGRRYAQTTTGRPSFRAIIDGAAGMPGWAPLSIDTRKGHQSTLRSFWDVVVGHSAKPQPWHTLMRNRTYPLDRAGASSSRPGAAPGAPGGPASSP